MIIVSIIAAGILGALLAHGMIKAETVNSEI